MTFPNKSTIFFQFFSKKRDQEELLISVGIKELYTGYVLLWYMEEMFHFKYNKNYPCSSHTPE